MIDPASPWPLYRQLADLIRADIRSGVLAAGAALPSARALREAHGLGAHAVEDALDVLHREGLISRAAGRRATVRTIGPMRTVWVPDGALVRARPILDEERGELGAPGTDVVAVIEVWMPGVDIPDLYRADEVEVRYGAP